MLLRGNGTPMFLLANVVDDIEMRIIACRARRGAPAEHAEAAAAVGGARRTSRRCGRTCRCSSTSSARSCRSAATRWPLEQYRDEGYLAEAMVNYLMTLGWAPPGDDEIVPWSTIERRVPAGGRQPFAGVLRRQEARRVQRRVHPQVVDRRVHRRLRAVPAGRRRAVASRAVRCSQVRGAGPASSSRVPTRWRRCRRASTSCSSPTRVLDEQAWDKTMSAPGAEEVLADDDRGLSATADWDADA